MQLILWRHAEAEDANPKGDLARALTKRGHHQAERMAAWLKPRLDGDWRILVSPARRALETVAPLGREYAVVESVATDAHARGVLKAAGWPENAHDVVVVGHQPTLGEVASLLFLGEEGEAAIRKGAIWWFETRGTAGRMNAVLKAVLSPDLLDV
ncbi:MAG: histidine phosphatase family protein [Burkholderiales bacterium]|nr:histidine phosphatase family protein [Burkholderiales bacterium]